MNPRPSIPPASVSSTAIAVTLLLAGTSGPGCRRDGDDFRVAESPKQTASQLETAFAGSSQFQGAARAASEALQSGDYQTAVESLQTIKASQDVTVQQGMAVHSSLVALEASLVSAMEAGDPKARQAYERLKAMKGK